MTQPVMGVQLRIEPGAITRLSRADPQTREPRVTHPPRLPPLLRVTPVHERIPSSQTPSADFEEALGTT